VCVRLHVCVCARARGRVRACNENDKYVVLKSGTFGVVSHCV
jgi:hypothetical protein